MARQVTSCVSGFQKYNQEAFIYLFFWYLVNQEAVTTPITWHRNLGR